MTTKFYRVVMPHYVAGMYVCDGKIVEAANIIAWAEGKTYDYFYNYIVNKRGGTIELLSEESDVKPTGRPRAA